MGTSPRMNDIVNLLAAFVGLRFENAENQVLCCTAMVEIHVCFLPGFTASHLPPNLPAQPNVEGVGLKFAPGMEVFLECLGCWCSRGPGMEGH